jgi:SH3-like domain-containing protein
MTSGFFIVLRSLRTAPDSVDPALSVIALKAAHRNPRETSVRALDPSRERPFIHSIMIRLTMFACAILAVLAPAWAQPGRAQAAQASATGQETGLTLPRLVSIRVDEVNVRTGPGLRYPVSWVFQRRDMPVEIVAEFENWRRIRDWEGAEGWVHRSMLSSDRAVLVVGDVATIRRDRAETAAAVARLAPGMVAKASACDLEWCRVEAEGYRGWLPRAEVWGLYPGEMFE